jgi:hypothetical protein
VKFWARYALRQLAAAAVVLGTASLLFILGDLIAYGHVNW